MKRTDILKAMDCLTDAELEEAGMDMEKKNRGKIFKIARSALVAAVAAALTVTAVAVTPLYRGAGESDSVAEGPVNEYGAKTKRITTEAFGRGFFNEDVRKLIDYGIREHEAFMAHEEFTEEEPDVTQPANWDEAERMLGIDLLDSDVLDASPAASYIAARGEGPEEGYYIECYDDGGEYGLHVYREQYVDGVNVQLIAAIFLGEDGTAERQVPVYELTEPETDPSYEQAEPAGRTLTMKTGRRIEFENYGANDWYNQFSFLESGVEYLVIFKSALWDDPDAIGYTHPDPIDYDGVVVKVMESLGFYEET